MSDKSIITYNQPKKGITIHDKRDTLKIGLSINEKDKKDYFKTRIKELEDANKDLKTALNSLSNRRDEIKYLKQFRELFSGHCFNTNTKLTIIQCSERIKKGKCNMADKCKTRKRILEKLYLQDLNISC